VTALGAAVGFAALAKVSGLGLALLGALVLGYVTLVAPGLDDRKDSPGSNDATNLGLAPRLAAFVRVIVPYAIVVALVAGWWYARNWMLYGEITGTAMMVSIFGARLTPLTLGQILTQLYEVWETFWVGFGWGNIRANPVVYAVLAAAVTLCALGLLAGLVRRRDHMRVTLVKAVPFFVLAGWMVVAGLELLNWMETTQAPHGRLLFPALPALAPLAAFGLSQWVPTRVQPIAVRAAGAVLFALAALAPFAILAPAYAYPAALSPAQVQNLPHRVDINFDHQLELLGYDVSTNHVAPGGATTLTLYWQALTKMDQDYSIGIHVLDPNGNVIAARDSYPGHGMLPTRLWYSGQMISDTYWLPIDAGAPAPTVGRIEISLYVRETKLELTAFDPQGKSITPIVGALKVGTATPVSFKPQQTADYTFDGKIDLIGYDASLARPAAGAPRLDLALYWKRQAPVPGDYTVFVHVLDANGNIVAQRDQPPDNGGDPTSLWDDGEIVPDRYSFDLPAGLAGAVRVETGLYIPSSGARLPVADGSGRAVGDHVTLEIGAGQ
jgi:hypothetical protein